MAINLKISASWQCSTTNDWVDLHTLLIIISIQISILLGSSRGIQFKRYEYIQDADGRLNKYAYTRN